MLEYLGREYVEVEDRSGNCGHETCIFLNRGCEMLQECGEIPYCMRWERDDNEDVYYEWVGDSCVE